MARKGDPKREAITRSALFFVFGLVAAIGFGGDVITGCQSLSLTATSAVITTSTTQPVTSTNADGDTETDDAAHIGFRFTVDGVEHEGSGVYLADPTPKTSVFLNARVLSREYAPGLETTAYYDPDDLSRTCLRQGLGPAGWALVGFILFFFGLGGFILLRGTKKHPGLLRLRRR